MKTYISPSIHSDRSRNPDICGFSSSRSCEHLFKCRLIDAAVFFWSSASGYPGWSSARVFHVVVPHEDRIQVPTHAEADTRRCHAGHLAGRSATRSTRSTPPIRRLGGLGLHLSSAPNFHHSPHPRRHLLQHVDHQSTQPTGTPADRLWHTSSEVKSTALFFRLVPLRSEGEPSFSRSSQNISEATCFVASIRRCSGGEAILVGRVSTFERQRQCQMACVCAGDSTRQPTEFHIALFAGEGRCWKGPVTAPTPMWRSAVVQCLGLKYTNAQLTLIHVGGTFNIPSSCSSASPNHRPHFTK